MDEPRAAGERAAAGGCGDFVPFSQRGGRSEAIDLEGAAAPDPSWHTVFSQAGYICCVQAVLLCPEGLGKAAAPQNNVGSDEVVGVMPAR